MAVARTALLAAIPGAIVGPGARDVCSPVVDVPVEMRGEPGRYQPGKLALKTVVTQYDGTRDTDALKLVCVP